MNRARRLPRRPATVLLTGFALVGLIASPALPNHTSTAGEELHPDLQTLEPANFSIQTSGGGGGNGNRPAFAGGSDDSEERLLFDNEVMNLHTGVLELVPTREKCTTGQGAEGRIALQRVYLDADGDGGFLRDVDTAFNEYVAGCMTFHANHVHWHFDDFALFELRNGGGTVASSLKMTFCVADVNRREEFFTEENELATFSPEEAYYTECKRNSVQGLSVGWGDLYPNGTSGQYIEVTDLADGVYCFVSTADPLDKLLETDDANNAADKEIELLTTDDGTRDVRVVDDVC